MNALVLTTRHRLGAFEGAACLLVYDVPNISGSTVGEDVRDLLDRRPNTRQIFVLAPFLLDKEVETAIREGTALQRASALGQHAISELSILSYSSDALPRRVVSKSFKLNGDTVSVEAWKDIASELREGWLYCLADSHGCLVNAPIGVHFSKASGKHASKFLRASSALLSTEACAVIGFFALVAVQQLEPRRIFVDTAPLLSVAMAMQRIAHARGLWLQHPPAKSFSSYGGVSRLPRLGRHDLVLISASTSGGLAGVLKEACVASNMLLTVFLLKSTVNMHTYGQVLCDLTHQPDRTFGYPLIDNYAVAECRMCKAGYVLAELEGDQFLLERRGVKRLRVGSQSQIGSARKLLETLARTGAFGVQIHGAGPGRSDTDIELGKLLSGNGAIDDAFFRLLRRFTPTPLDFVVAVGMTAEEARTYCIQAGLELAVNQAQIVSYGDIGKLSASAQANALVVLGVLADHSQVRGVNAQLRPRVNGGAVAYIAAMAVAESARNLADLRIFLQYGEHGPETFTFRAASELMLPWSSGNESPWAAEQRMWRAAESDGNLSDLGRDRLNWLAQHGRAGEGLFLDGVNGPLRIAPDFAMLDTSIDRAAISQADLYVVVSNALAAERCNRQALGTAVSRTDPMPVWGQSLYVQSLLCPSNFRDFNDAVLRAALLRAANVQELNFAVDEACSEEMFDVIRVDIESWAHGKGDALPEFLLSMASGRLKMMQGHMERIRSLVAASALPEYLMQMADRIGKL